MALHFPKSPYLVLNNLFAEHSGTARHSRPKTTGRCCGLCSMSGGGHRSTGSAQGSEGKLFRLNGLDRLAQNGDEADGGEAAGPKSRTDPPKARVDSASR